MGRPGGEPVGGFGIAPANRGVQAGWAYAVVRHPMYLGYMIMQLGYLMHNPSPRNLAVYGIAWMFQVARIEREERHLLRDAAYQHYAGRVRRRLVPGVY
jgi:protein-S-isoprenylcysteine O-methyltransferase Ste14